VLPIEAFQQQQDLELLYMIVSSFFSLPAFFCCPDGALEKMSDIDE
jgi:hypothetical protein